MCLFVYIHDQPYNSLWVALNQLPGLHIARENLVQNWKMVKEEEARFTDCEFEEIIVQTDRLK